MFIKNLNIINDSLWGFPSCPCPVLISCCSSPIYNNNHIHNVHHIWCTFPPTISCHLVEDEGMRSRSGKEPKAYYLLLFTRDFPNGRLGLVYSFVSLLYLLSLTYITSWASSGWGWSSKVHSTYIINITSNACHGRHCVCPVLFCSVLSCGRGY